MTTEEITRHYKEVRSCKFKRTYHKKTIAKAAARRMNLKTESGRIRAYPCSYCSNYHIGHIKPSYADKIEAERIEKVLKHAV